jgi:hypothetical protein
MNSEIKIVLAIAFSLVAANAAALDTSKILLCASLEVHECVDGSPCAEVRPEDVGAPTFIWIDFDEREIRASVEGRASKIDHMEEVEDRLVLQGVEDGREDLEDGSGWAISIDTNTGRMVGTAAVSQAAIVIFGACTET